MTEVAAASRAKAASRRRSPPSTASSCSGRPGVVAISLLVMCSTFISLNGNALTGPRAYFAMARDGLFPAALCRDPSRGSRRPANAILAQGIWAILLTVAATTLILIPAAAQAPAPALARPDPRRLVEAQPDAALRCLVHVRDLRRQRVLHAGDHQRVRAPQHASPTCPARTGRGAIRAPPCSTWSPRCCSWATCWSTNEPRRPWSVSD